MKKFLLVLLAITALGQDKVDLKKNRQLQSKTYKVREAQRIREDFLSGWVKECSAQGKILTMVDSNLIACVVKSPEAPKAQTPAKGPARKAPVTKATPDTPEETETN